jgi:hypothetical protein
MVPDTIFVWTSKHDVAFSVLKSALQTAPILALPDFNKPFALKQMPMVEELELFCYKMINLLHTSARHWVLVHWDFLPMKENTWQS